MTRAPMEHYQIDLSGRAVIVVDVQDAHDAPPRLREITQRLTKLGATPIANRTFMLDAGIVRRIEAIKSLIEGLLAAGDVLLVTHVDDGLKGTLIVAPRADDEGVRVVNRSEGAPASRTEEVAP